MARTISDEELQLRRRARRRLVGAVVLVIAIVVVLPMVLDSEPKPSGGEVAVRIPSPDSGTFSPKLVTKAPAPKTAPKARAAQEKKRQAPAVPPAPKPAPQKAAKADAKPVAKPVAPAPTKLASPRYVIQVIALADADKANQLRERIAAAGIKSYTETVKTVKGDVTRVRAGPFKNRKAAENAHEKLKTIGLSGNITTK